MAPRSNWKGYLKLSLVSASIAIYPATSSSEKVRFNTLNRATGNRLKRQMVDAVTGEVVESDEQVKGYAIGKDTYVQVEDEELAEVAIVLSAKRPRLRDEPLAVRDGAVCAHPPGHAGTGRCWSHCRSRLCSLG